MTSTPEAGATRPVREVMRHGVVLCDADATVRAVARAMRDHGVRSVLAVDLSGEAVGLIDERDLLKGWDRPDEARAVEVMDAAPLTVDPAEPAGEVAAMMLRAGATRVLVAPPAPSQESGRWSEWKERGLPAGLLTVADLLARIDELGASRRPAARPAPTARRATPALVYGSLAAAILLIGLLVFFAVNSHPAVPHAGCAIPTQGGC
ncbi:MAG TPA: CBS domain-containing protein [Candidatus Dormibacteraeota bacterium]|jgi:CBS domain-containing protein|nr:CBS domain-containing protein [Candidatus Dormibacteraeota bacterium]